MNQAPHTFIASALLFLHAGTLARAGETPPAPVPKVAFSEVRNDSLKRVNAPGETPAFEVRTNTETTILVKIPLTNFDPTSLDESTPVGVSVGGFSHEATLGDSVNWSSGRNRAKFPVLVDTDDTDDEGDPIQKRVGTIVYTWSDRKLVVAVTGRGMGSVVADSAEDFFADVEGSKVRFLEPIDVGVNFGEQSGEGSLFAKGVAKKVTKTKGRGDAAESFDLYFVAAVSFYDTAPPMVQLIDPAEGAEVDSDFPLFTGNVKDNVDAASSLTVSKVLLNGVDVTDQVSAEFTDEDKTVSPTIPGQVVVDGIELTARENTIEFSVTDSSGNTTVVTRHIIYTGGTAPDTTAPVVTIDDPVEGAVVTFDTLSISGTASDNLDEASSLEVTQVLINGVNVTADVAWLFQDGDSSAVPAIPGSVAVENLVLTEGVNTIVITVSDQAGNTTVVTRHVTYLIES